MSWYRFFRFVCKCLTSLVTHREVQGKENLPKAGPFILVANHQSFLDPILVQVSCRRPVHTLAKSTQFAGGFMGWLMPRINAIPTRRYRIDPQAVRVLLRRLDQGEGVGLYPEGERSWDADLQPFRRGTIRVLLKTGVPIIPVGVVGSYDVWPRWSRTIRRGRVKVTFGEPIQWAPMHRRSEREAFLPEATDTIRSALADLSRWDRLEAGSGERRSGEVLRRKPEWLKKSGSVAERGT